MNPRPVPFPPLVAALALVSMLGCGGPTRGEGGAAPSGGAGGTPAPTGGGDGSVSPSGGSGGSAGRDAAPLPGPDAAGLAPDAPAPPDGAVAAPADAALVPPTTGGCQAARFCEDFEAQTAGMAPRGNFQVNTAGGGSVTVDGTRAFTGKQSVTIKAPRGGGYPGQFLTFSNLAAQLPSNDLHGRAMIYLAQLPGDAHWDGVIASGPLSGGGNATYILGGMYKNFMSVYHPGDCSVDSKTPFPVGKWACLQWQFKGAKDGTHLHRMLLDGQLVDNGEQNGNQGFCVQGAASREWRAPTFSTLKVGYVHYGNSPGPVQLWIDDLAFGEAPIPCPTSPPAIP